MEYLSGLVYTRGGFAEGYVAIEDGRVSEVSEGACPGRPSAEGVIVPGLVNGHTHAADGGLRIPPGMPLEDLVAPPDGLKHRYLRETPAEVLKGSMREYARTSAENGISVFVDFREGGEEGCRMLRSVSDRAVILGRPVSPEYDPCEIDGILSVADGIGLPSVSDVPPAYLEAVADHVRRERRMLALHVSERVREDIDTVLSLDPSFVVHMTEASDGDILKCAEAEVPIVACVRSNALFGRVPPLARMFETGADVAMGTDNAMLCSPDMRAEAGAFARVLSCQGGDPRDALDALLAGGRKILYRQTEIGLAAGNEADLAVVEGGKDPLTDLTSCARRISRIGI